MFWQWPHYISSTTPQSLYIYSRRTQHWTTCTRSVKRSLLFGNVATPCPTGCRPLARAFTSEHIETSGGRTILIEWQIDCSFVHNSRLMPYMYIGRRTTTHTTQHNKPFSLSHPILIIISLALAVHQDFRRSYRLLRTEHTKKMIFHRESAVFTFI